MDEFTPISVLKKRLDITAGENWQEYEVETLILSLGVLETPLLRDKINLLRVLKIKPELFYSEALFFMHAVPVMNNIASDFDHVPHLTSLEIAFSVKDMSVLLSIKEEDSPTFGNEVREVIKYVLTEEGFSEAVYPFNIVGITGLVAGQTKEDTQNKQKAIIQYVQSMYTKSGS